MFGVISISIFTALLLNVHPFLAPVRPGNSGSLIIEGWVPDYCCKAAVSRFRRGNYRYIFVTGGPLESGSYLKEFGTYAELGAETLRQLSLPDSAIIAVPAQHSTIDRTWGSALALKMWLDSADCSITTFDLLSKSTHTRRSTLFFRRVLGKRCTVGSIAIENPDYNPRRWWTSSNGFRQTVDEGIAYLYALLFVVAH